jgi:hypothetical protein
MGVSGICACASSLEDSAFAAVALPVVPSSVLEGVAGAASATSSVRVRERVCNRHAHLGDPKESEGGEKEKERERRERVCVRERNREGGRERNAHASRMPGTKREEPPPTCILARYVRVHVYVCACVCVVCVCVFLCVCVCITHTPHTHTRERKREI